MSGPGTNNMGEWQQVLLFILMLTGSRCSLEDLRMIHGDQGLKRLLQWTRCLALMRQESGCAIRELEKGWRDWNRVYRRVRILDMNATQIVAEKRNGALTYKGERGHLPMVGNLAEADVVIHDDFRVWNVATATARLEFIRVCEALLPQRHTRRATLRVDSASYQTRDKMKWRTPSTAPVPFNCGFGIIDKIPLGRYLLSP
ncbi:hypothetical protein RIE95_17150 [Acidithiobacillus thiooxidans]|uniref:hypothetical protein n=1 Tax=Acidithiobacillus thiooxidans TaxID=930 RepID=UPI0028625AC2|nr:hypothetical protein [Acidithiobacillus thiooxidans]MDR7928691.1 hypothetical protein [Acidithiobacillus thiooxidans]